MTSEIDEFEGCFFNDPFSPFIDSSSSIDILEAFQQHNYNYTPNNLLIPSTSSPPLTTQENFDTPFDHELDQITSSLQHSSPSPPISNQLESLSLNQMPISVTSSNESLDFSSLDVKLEEGQLPLYDHTNSNYYYGGPHNALKMMQRSYSSNSFQQGKPNGVLYQPKFDGLTESPTVHSEVLLTSSHDHHNSFSSTHMRRASSTGDLQSPNVSQTSQRLSSSPLATKSSFMEEANFKVGRYNAEERKEKILRYRAKKTQRNFNKTIKYACRKTLADNRPRIRGRFARNDEPGELIPKTTTTYNRYRDEDELWMMEGFHEEISDEGMIGRGQFFSTYPSSSIGQFHQFSFIQN